MKKEEKAQAVSVPVKDKVYLTINEASEYFNMSTQLVRKLTDETDCVLWLTNRRLINRAQFEEALRELQKQKREELIHGRKTKKRT